jgi:hypothetical protein
MFGWFKKKAAPKVSLDGSLSPEADRFLREATAEFNKKQEALHRDWRFNETAQWAYDQDGGVLRLSFPDGAGVEADGQILGSYSPSDASWEWAWNNPNIDAKVARDSRAVRDVGKRYGIAYLGLGRIPLPSPKMISYLCAIGLKATASVGIYEGEAGPIKIMIMLKNMRKVSA